MFTQGSGHSSALTPAATTQHHNRGQSAHTKSGGTAQCVRSHATCALTPRKRTPISKNTPADTGLDRPTGAYASKLPTMMPISESLLLSSEILWCRLLPPPALRSSQRWRIAPDVAGKQRCKDQCTWLGGAVYIRQSICFTIKHFACASFSVPNFLTSVRSLSPPFPSTSTSISPPFHLSYAYTERARERGRKRERERERERERQTDREGAREGGRFFLSTLPCHA